MAFKSAGERNKRNDKYQFWQQDNHPEECITAEMLQSKLKYLHGNPMRAGLVRQEWDYVYSSAIEYYTTQKGLVQIDFVLQIVQVVTDYIFIWQSVERCANATVRFFRYFYSSNQNHYHHAQDAHRTIHHDQCSRREDLCHHQ